ncbi:unnamed protein product [Hyaloperonospora brassicae]|uniref:RxLR effector candidate protein n=1 Tax=Hyaloperonospora brassicae TaxID=162125 RepID=A0AAV0UW49_HYABA|nr:unnamed protein product [Hyaloperonospora brassicae]
MKLLNLIALSVSASVFVAADIAWASNASPEKLNFESTEDPKSHGRGRLRGPAEERMASLEPLAEGTTRVVGEVLPKIESIGMSANTVAEKVGGLAAGRAAAKKRLKRMYASNWRPGFLRWFKATQKRGSSRNQRLSQDLRAVVRREIQQRLLANAVTDLDLARVEEEITQKFMAELREAEMESKASAARRRNRRVTREEGTTTSVAANDA